MQNEKNFTLEKDDSPAAPGASSPSGKDALYLSAIKEIVQTLAPKPFRKRHPILFWGFWVFLALCVTGGGITASLDEEANLTESPRLAMVRVEGPILNTRQTLRWISKVSADESVKGVLLRIDSPGGGAAASQEIYEALKALAARKPVVASMGSVAASGGLMVAMAAPHIVANPSTVTGSIGVRMDVPQLQGLMGKLGLGQETLTTGRFKDAGSTTRPMTAEEKQYLGRILQDMHEQFVQLVAEGRKMPADKVRVFADGRIFTGREAKELGLVDTLGGQDEAVRALRQQTGLSAKAKLVEQPKESKLWKELMETVLGVDVSTGLGALQSGAGPVPAFLFAY